MNEADRLETEIAALEAAQWLIKDRTTVQECWTELERAKKARRKRLEKIQSGE